MARKRKIYSCYKNNEFLVTGNTDEIAEYLGLSSNRVSRYIHGASKDYDIVHVATDYPVYALYRQERFIDSGSIPQLAEILDVKEETLRFYSAPSSKRRSDISIVKLEDETVRVRHTLNDKYAPTPTDTKYDPELKEVITINKPVKKVEWKPQPYTRMLFDHMFTKWSVKS